MKHLVALLVLLASAIPSDGAPQKELGSVKDIEKAAAALRDAKPLPSMGIDTAGLNWYQTLSLDSKLTVIIVSRNLGGSLLVFDGEGRFKSAAETEEVLSVQLVRLVGDSWNLLLTTLDGFGTGVRYEGFHLFVDRDRRFVEVWHGEGYVFEMRPGQAPAVETERVGLVRVIEASAGLPAQLLHSVEDAVTGHRQISLWEVANGRLVKRALAAKERVPSRIPK